MRAMTHCERHGGGSNETVLAIGAMHPPNVEHLYDHSYHYHQDVILISDEDALIERLSQLLDDNRCPRCGNKLPERPWGSTVTVCRCIPLCVQCAADELVHGLLAFVYDVQNWPDPVASLADFREYWCRAASPSAAEKVAILQGTRDVIDAYLISQEMTG